MLLNLRTRREYDEIVIGIVGAVGSKLGLVQDSLVQAFKEAGYKAHPVHLVEMLHEIDRWENLEEELEDARIEQHMDAGDDFRKDIKSDDALAVLGISKIRKIRHAETGNADIPAKRTAYILKSLKHPEEIDSLREIYGPGFFVVAVYSPRETRVETLASKIAKSHNAYDPDEYREAAERLVSRDQKDSGKTFGQNVRQSFPLADIFLDSPNEESLLKETHRFVRLLLGDNSYTPTRDECAMAHAHLAALRSGALGRQVGAVIVTPEGQIISVGTNEVPKYRGGQYWEGDQYDARDIRREFDSSDSLKQMNVGEVLDRLAEQSDWLTEKITGLSSQERVKKVLPLLKGTRIMQPLEYGRAVHAEMAAIVDAALRGVPTAGSILHTTTFPCHECARHIIAAGIEKVVFIEPYPKSLAAQLHEDSISVEATVDNRVVFKPFIGIAPRQFANLFPIFGDRKESDGKRIAWRPENSLPRIAGFPNSYTKNENDALELLYKRMDEQKLKAVGSK
jgi:deoxycytidylate deaminase